MPILKDLKLKHIIYQKAQSTFRTSSSMGKRFDDQAIDSDVKRYEEVIKSITRQDEDYFTGYLFSIS